MAVLLQSADFQPDDVIERCLNTDALTGAVVNFVGLVRQNADGTLRSMTLEHYPAMAQRALEDLEATARNQFDLNDLVILHRYGRLEPGERIMMVATASAHRTEAFAAAEFLMDFLKIDAPFWKKEDMARGASWVSAKSTDDEKRELWLT